VRLLDAVAQTADPLGLEAAAAALGPAAAAEIH